MSWLFDLFVQPLVDLLIPKTSWSLFVRLVLVVAAVAAYLVAEDAGALPWQSP